VLSTLVVSGSFEIVPDVVDDGTAKDEKKKKKRRHSALQRLDAQLI
jgi:hypothetical protein